MKKNYISLVAVLILIIIGVTYFSSGPKSGKEIVIYEGLQSQIGDLRIGVGSIKETAEYVDIEGNAVDKGESMLSGPVAKLFIYDLASETILNVFNGDHYSVGQYEIDVKDIVVGTEEWLGNLTLLVTGSTDEDLTVIDNVISTPSNTKSENQIIAYGVGFLKVLYGDSEKDWEVVSEDRIMINGRVYDKLTIKLSGGTEELVHFDVTESLRNIAREELNNLENISFSKNSGESMEDAIIIMGAKGEKDGIDSEYKYLESKYGLKEIDWELELQSLLSEKGKSYDKMDIKLADGTKKTIYFDITNFFGKY